MNNEELLALIAWLGRSGSNLMLRAFLFGVGLGFAGAFYFGADYRIALAFFTASVVAGFWYPNKPARSDNS